MRLVSATNLAMQNTACQLVFLLLFLAHCADAFLPTAWVKPLILAPHRQSYAITPSRSRVRFGHGHQMCIEEDRTAKIKQLFKPIFNIVDSNRDGFLDKFELAKSDPNADVSEAIIQLREFDLDKDGKLNMEEAMFTCLRAYFLSSYWYSFKDAHFPIPSSDTARLLRLNDLERLSDLLGRMSALQYAHFRSSVADFVSRNVDFLADHAVPARQDDR